MADLTDQLLSQYQDYPWRQNIQTPKDLIRPQGLDKDGNQVHFYVQNTYLMP
jgi:hypothetical protein